ncbi:MAG: PDZ domain-containing protein [Patescibacteria group bacterium]
MNKDKKNISKKDKINLQQKLVSEEKYPAFSSSFVTIISSALISLVVGSIGCLLVVPYFINPQSGSDVQISDYNWGGNGLVIRDPKTVVVNQDLKVEESLNSISKSMIKFYPNLQASSSDSLIKKIDEKKYYLLKEPFSAGLIMSVDGWVLALWPAKQTEVDLKKIINNFEGLSSEGKTYRIDKATLVEKILDEKLPSNVTPVLIHLSSASNLPVRSLAKPADLKVGQSLFSYNGARGVNFGFLIGREKTELLRSSEDSSEELSVNFELTPVSGSSFIFNLAGDLLAWQNSNGKVFPVYALNARLNSLFKLGRFSTPLFGVNYYNLSDLKIPGFNQDKGALLYSSGKSMAVNLGSPAEKAGLKNGDLILEVNGEVINGNNDLGAIIQNYLPGQDLLISYSRSGVNLETSLRLGELK